MKNQNLLIYDFPTLFEILEEIKHYYNFDVFDISDEQILKVDSKIPVVAKLIISKNKIPDIKDQFIFDYYPLTITKLIEYINIEFLKKNFNDQSEISVGAYKIDLNSKEIKFKDKKVKLTEKETNVIIFLSKSETQIKINELQSWVWGHQSQLETHTVETHIYRLRKKILTVFGDSDFIISHKNGYQIKK